MARILAVDDSPLMRQLVASTLSAGGHHVEVAADGRQALLAAEHAQFDAVVADVSMPALDGIALVRELRRRPAYRHTPLLLFTIEASVEHRLRGQAAGATGWLIKPVAPDRLLAVISSVLRP